MKTNYINPFPLPAAVSEVDDLAVSNLVLQLMEEKGGAERIEIIRQLEDAINALGYKLYDLNHEEVMEIEHAIQYVQHVQMGAL